MSSISFPTTNSLLIPSQAMSSANAATNTSSERGQARPSGGQNRRTMGRRPRARTQEPSSSEPSEATEQQGKPDEPRQADVEETVSTGTASKKKRVRKKKPPAADKQGEQQQMMTAPAGPTKSRRRNRKRTKHVWRRQIPPGSMDPITLDPLESLAYPPFALAATEPYDPIPEWPVVDDTGQGNTADLTDSNDKLTEEEREKLILKEQWGLTHPDSKLKEEAPVESLTSGKRHYNLFDGRALAYYLVSQLQFIDPFNRRDLTRAELVNLDAYLTRHGFKDLKVVEAYDAKGVTISRSGAVGATAAGRASILQQEAQVLLNALFGAHHGSSGAYRNPLQEQYAAAQPGRQSTSRRRNRNMDATEDSGIYGDDDGGMIVIDDDANPGLRGTGFRSATAFSDGPDGHNHPLSAGPSTLWSASHIASEYSHNSAVQAQNFPALPTPSSAPPDGTTSTDVKAAPSRSLQKITQVVSKTDPEELKRQEQARDEMHRRAMLANLWLTESGAIPPVTSPPPVQPASFVPNAADSSAGPSEGQLRRNQAFASALGVAPATMRPSFNKGWSRPSDGTIQLDEFGNELNAAQYPDSLIMQAQERMAKLLKLEKNWIAFLADDQSGSLPLRPMDRPLRAFVHAYSDYWRLQTESFDREPMRYIHCVKLKATIAPVPLLSEVAKHWRGPSVVSLVPTLESLPRAPRQAEATSDLQSTGETTQSRDFPPPPSREPLKLKPRSLVTLETSPGRSSNLPDEAAGMESSVDAQLTNRFNSLFQGRERPKVELAPRTKPLELPAYEPPKTYSVVEERERQQATMAEKTRKEREAQMKKQNILMQAFASSDEDGTVSDGNISSDWEQGEAEFVESDSED